MHSHTIRTSLKQGQMILEGSPTGGIIEQFSPMATPLTVPTPLEISTPFTSLESSLPHHQFPATNPPMQPQCFNRRYNQSNFENNSTMWTTSVDEQQRRDSEYQFGMVQNGTERGGSERGGNEPFNYWSIVADDTYMVTGMGSIGRGGVEGMQGRSYPPPGTSQGYSDWIANSSTAAKAGASQCCVCWA